MEKKLYNKDCITLDGRLDEQVWESVETYTGFKPLGKLIYSLKFVFAYIGRGYSRPYLDNLSYIRFGKLHRHTRGLKLVKSLGKLYLF